MGKCVRLTPCPNNNNNDNIWCVSCYLPLPCSMTTLVSYVVCEVKVHNHVFCGWKEKNQCSSKTYVEVSDKNRQQFVCKLSAASSMTSWPQRHGSSPSNTLLIFFLSMVKTSYLTIWEFDRIVTFVGKIAGLTLYFSFLYQGTYNREIISIRRCLDCEWSVFIWTIWSNSQSYTHVQVLWSC